jgi:hypothetical protein
LIEIESGLGNIESELGILSPNDERAFDTALSIAAGASGSIACYSRRLRRRGEARIV